MKHGYGTYFYSDNEYYEGEWYADDRCGWGRMYYADGSVYEGEWDGDKCSGRGMLRLANDNRYEGEWKGGKKNGHGKFFYLDSGQVYGGVWVDDIPKCGSMTDFGREGAPKPTVYPIPKIELVDPEQVVAKSEEVFISDDL
uniref:MORN repeat-containing protein 3 n=1 Tax=Ciona savignyi TaxID=51511 RepID=H2YB92_CIOSA